ncbi:MAG: TrbG/VirB9 family P-type conjugative transfer protein [Deltaproteobacteria bacterium]
MFALSAQAEITPPRGQYDSHVRIASYVDGQVYLVMTSLTHVTSVEFGEGEVIQSIIAGDTKGFAFDGVPGGRAFAIKPLLGGVRTNVTVYTNLHAYYFNVVETRDTTHYVVRFKYPESKMRPTNAVSIQPPNYNYGVSSRKGFAPASVWDDGTFTYFQFAHNVEVPAIFLWADGNERTVNSTAQSDGVMRVSGVSDRWVLRLGDAEICVQDMSSKRSGS